MSSRKSPATNSSERAAALKGLQRIPGVGPSIAQDLYEQGWRRVDELKTADPEALYERQCELQGGHVDRCWLYVARCAVYFAQSLNP
jgi:predicted flap endonuclease-1-like 5' DNA nuclease